MLYSTLIAQLFDISVKFLSLTQKKVFVIKKIRKGNDIYNNYLTTIKNLRIRNAIFFVMIYCCLVFFWYFVSAFCAVYANTQMIALKDSLGSLLISMFYPLVLYLIPSGLRILALKNRCKLKHPDWLYRISNIIPLL